MSDSAALEVLKLEILASAYEISVGGRTLARLEGGPLELLAGAGERLRDLDIETAIERSEDWLMPVSKSFQGLALQVKDNPGRLRDHFATAASLTPDDIERAFSRAFDDVAFKRAVSRDLVADLVLLRELVHHGGLPRVLMD